MPKRRHRGARVVTPKIEAEQAKEIARQLASLGNNTNQIAKRLNGLDSVTAEQVKELKHELNRMVNGLGGSMATTHIAQSSGASRAINYAEKRAEENKLEVLKEIVMVIGLAMVLFSSLAFAYLLIKFIFGAAIGTVWTNFFKFASLGHLTGGKAAGLVAFQVLLKLLSTLFILLAGIGLYFLPLGL